MMYKLFILLLFIGLWTQMFSQEIFGKDSLLIKTTIVDKHTSEVMPYATIYNQTTGKGTISNLDGYFSLGHISLNDVLSISFVGYEKKIIIASNSTLKKVIYLSPKPELLNAVTVFGNNGFLYDLLINCKKSQPKINKTAKTYYSLKSRVNDYQVELVESYYNGLFSGYNVEKLDLKNGRVALSYFENRFFVSTESSRALYMHKLFYKNDYFPISPFEFKKNKLLKQYDLAFVSKYIEEDSTIVYVIDFSPKDDFAGAFNGRVWIDSLNTRIIKVNLKIANSIIHPFTPHGNIDSLTRVNMNITKTFYKIDNESYVKSVDFDYEVNYKTTDKLEFSVNTNAVLYAYDYSNSFLLPKFKFSNGSYGDYRKINASPYNQFFWEHIDEFRMKDLTRDNKIFVQQKSSISKQTIFLNNAFFTKGFFEHPYVFWSQNRIKLREETTYNEAFLSDIPSERYNLEVQLYLDINKLKDSLHIVTATVFDPFETFYYYPLTNEGMAFINMYFDLIEIHRRELEEKLKNLESIDEMMSIYDVKMEYIEELSREFFKEVEHGTNIKGMMKWNNFIIKKIGIDNVTLFNLYSNE